MSINLPHRRALLSGAPLPANNLFALVGDSRPRADHNNSTDTTIYHISTGIGQWVEYLTGARVRFLYADDYAVGGSTSEDLVNNQLAAAISSPAASVVFLTSTNDQGAKNWSASRSIAAISTAISGLLAAGKFVYVIAELPRGAASFTSARFTAQQQIDHDLVRAYLLGLSAPRLTVIDAYPTIADLTGTPTDFADGKSYDGVHPSIDGASTIAKVIAPYIIARYAPDPYVFNPSDTFNASTNPHGNLVTNGEMAGTGGSLASGVSGSVAMGYSTSVNAFTGLTAVCSKVTTATGDWQQVVLTGNSGAGYPMFNMHRNLTFAHLTTGDALDGRGEFEVDAGSVGLHGVSLQVARYFSGSLKGLSRAGERASGPWPAEAVAAKWRLSSLVTLLGDENTVQTGITINVGSNTTGVNITVRLRNIDVRKA